MGQRIYYLWLLTFPTIVKHQHDHPVVASFIASTVWKVSAISNTSYCTVNMSRLTSGLKLTIFNSNKGFPKKEHKSLTFIDLIFNQLSSILWKAYRIKSCEPCEVIRKFECIFNYNWLGGWQFKGLRKLFW